MFPLENASPEKHLLNELRFLMLLQEIDRRTIKSLTNKRERRDNYDYVRRKIVIRRKRLRLLYKKLFDN